MPRKSSPYRARERASRDYCAPQSEQTNGPFGDSPALTMVPPSPETGDDELIGTGPSLTSPQTLQFATIVSPAIGGTVTAKARAAA